MATLSREQAKAVVDDVRVINGGLPEGVWRALPEEAQRSWRNLQTLAGGSIRHVAEDLYDEDTRFIFELIQNAEDNRYGNAVGRGEEPFLHFTLDHDRMFVDTNEDGFNENDVRAICSIHNSSKQQTGGYIGHKGIGFKSVFKIAHKVCIQSGPFCFAFEHRKGESGLGMITPFNQEFEALPPGVRTRITLFLIQREDFETRARELKEIPDTLLLFLRKLRKLQIEIVPSAFHMSFTRQEHKPRRLITLIKEADDATDERIYHVQKTILSELPEHASRPRQTTAEVILAFPVDKSFAPVIEPQYVYSFLPMRVEGFNFLIQSDFITPASRQGIHQCARNNAIREGISHLFVDAVHYFCSHATMKYEWLQYLPGTFIFDPFWAALREMIFDKLKESKVLETRKGVLRYPETLQHPSSRHCDQHGQPLLDDLTPEIYLSGSYNWSLHADSLTELGVTNLSFNKILDRLDPYLLGLSPRFLDPSLDDDWHARVADLLLRALQTYGSKARQRIEDMDLIPTSRGTLLSANHSNVHFPVDENAHSVPECLSLDLVDVSASQNLSRRKLFEALGITPCPIHKVISAILKRYNQPSGVTLRDSVDHLKYLYCNLGKQETLDKRVFLMDQMERPVYRSLVTFGAPIIIDDLYFATDGEYGNKRLLQKLKSASDQGNVRSHGRSWKWWLENMAGVRRVPRLKDNRREELSVLGQQMAAYYPMTLIGVLKTYWSSYQQELTPKIINGLKRMEVPRRNTIYRSLLKHQYYPSQKLLKICTQAAVEEHFSHFLDVPAEMITDTTDGWGFLATFGVGLEPDVKFFAHIVSELTCDIIGALEVKGLFKVYEELSLRFSNDAETVKEVIFYETLAVCLPMTRKGTADVTSLSECVWDGHRCLRTRHALAVFPEYSDNRHIVYLFRNMLDLHDADLNAYLEELQSRKQGGPVDDLCDIYNIISQMTGTPGEIEVVRDTFFGHNLVYVPARSLWVAPESCVWTEAPEIGGKYGISTVYPQLGDLFQKVLDIQVPTAMTYIAQLRIIISDESNISGIKTVIYRINALWPSAGDIETLCSMRFLPVEMPDGSVKLLRPGDAFFISDRLEYQSTFRRKAPLLKFSLEESRKLYRLWEALGLEDRYLSKIVEERTIVERPASEPSSHETRVFQRRAKHLHRCVLHYNPETSETDGTILREKLQRAAVYESDGFKRTLLLHQNEFAVTVQTGDGLVHIEGTSDALRIYVPRNPQDRLKCYSLHLPNALARFLGLKAIAAWLTFQLVFLSAEEMVEDLLDSNGIVRVPAADFPEPELQPEDDSDSHSLLLDGVLDADEISNTTEGMNGLPSLPETTVDISSNVGSTDFERTHRSRHTRHHLEASRISETHHHAPSPSPPPIPLPRLPLAPSDGETGGLTREAQYAELLRNVIRLARQATLPDAGQVPTNGNDIAGNITAGVPFGVRSESQLAHDIKIGAAGELYVFELLQTLNLPDFGRYNWQSTIRKEVAVHPDYHDLTPWNGVETSDLVYHDTGSALTTLLIQAGYLPRERWEGARPTYYIEVKTTTGQYDRPFYMSKGQYRRMQRMQIDLEGEASEEIYLIFRAYHLNKESMGVKLYIDPENLRQDGRLNFTAESYSVLPSQT